MIKLIKSYKFWTGFAGFAGMVVTLLSEHIGLNITADGAKEFIMAICGVLITLGIVKKPTSSKEETAKLEQPKNKEETLKTSQQNGEENKEQPLCDKSNE